MEGVDHRKTSIPCKEPNNLDYLDNVDHLDHLNHSDHLDHLGHSDHLDD